MKVTCSLAKLWMPAFIDAPPTPGLRAHLESCIGCQAEMSKYGRLQRELSALGSITDLAPAGLVVAVGVAIAEGVATAEAPTKGYVAAIAVAGGTAVALGAAAVIRRRYVHSV